MRRWKHHHPIGTWGRVLGRGLVLSIGTLQLSIRCPLLAKLAARQQGAMPYHYRRASKAGRSGTISAIAA
jgi:hypothetical protein